MADQNNRPDSDPTPGRLNDRNGDENASNGVGMDAGLTRYGDLDFSRFLRNVFLKSAGHSDFGTKRPIIGIVDTGSDYNSCHRTVPDLIDAIKRGVMLAGGLPMTFPVISLHESFAYPTSMHLRNLMAMTVEEMIRAQPMDAVVLIGGCDKTVPALLMGAFSADLPAILEVTGPMLAGSHRGERVGACTDCRRYWADYRAGRIDAATVSEIEADLAPSAGTCMVMGTASTMACMTEAMGLMLPGGASIPAVYSDRVRHAEATGARAVSLAREGAKPSRLIDHRAIENALRTLLAIGGSTNGLVHLAAMVGRLGFRIDLDRLHAFSAATPVVVDLKPSGKDFMEDLYRAGGLARVLREIADLLHLDAPTVAGMTLGESLRQTPCGWSQDVVRPVNDPVFSGASLVVLKGSLAPNGALVKQSAADAALLEHRGRAIVFEDLDDLAQRIDDPAVGATKDDILILRNAGPVGAPGMPEAGYIPIPRYLAAEGVKDMVRISDARMSGTAYGTIILHVSPEAAIGGPLALVATGDTVHLSVADRRLDLEVSDATLAERVKAARVRHRTAERGYNRLFLESVQQVEDGCDFNFMRPSITRTVPVEH
jgi:dihydroxy-acid dehydratase